jgi:hypothetical protein
MRMAGGRGGLGVPKQLADAEILVEAKASCMNGSERREKPRARQKTEI